MNSDDVYEIAKMWLPDEVKGVVKISSFTGGTGFVSLHFDDEYELYISRRALLNLRSLINESVDALDAFEKFDKFKNKLTTDAVQSNVLEFKRKDEP
jgi:hypothetical protein